MNRSNNLIEVESSNILQSKQKRHRILVCALVGIAVLVLAGISIGCIKKAEPLPAEASDLQMTNALGSAAGLDDYVSDDSPQFGSVVLATPPYIICGNRLYFHVADTSFGISLSELGEAAYGFDSTPLEFELLSESGELSEQIYLRNPEGSQTDTTGNRPLYWVFNYVCDTSLEIQGRMIYGRYGLLENDSIYAGKLLKQGNVEVYEYLMDGDESTEDLYILKVKTVISDILDIEPISNEVSGTWWEMKPVYEASLPDDWAILLLASPD